MDPLSQGYQNLQHQKSGFSPPSPSLSLFLLPPFLLLFLVGFALHRFVPQSKSTPPPAGRVVDLGVDAEHADSDGVG